MSAELYKLARLGRVMHEKQKEYFRTRSRDVLDQSKEYERFFDEAVALVLDPHLDMEDGDGE